MSDRFHIIITGENGRSSCFQFSRKKLLTATALAVTSIITASLIAIVSGGSFFLGQKIQKLETELATTTQVNKVYLSEIEQLKSSRNEQIESLKKDYEFQLTNQKARYDLENTNLQLENVKLMNSAIGDLHSRSVLIESVMDQIGVEIIEPASEMAGNSGGPFVPDVERPHEELMKKVDTYLRTINYMPLGRPLDGFITSAFGKRIDPINKRNAFHEGVDIRGNNGEKVRATAAGVVVRAFINAGYGKYVEIDHGNGYRTIFAHLEHYIVKKGDSVERGQIIGQLGNTGRSTGPHLHYEIRLNKKPINPQKFMKVADLTHAIADSAH